MLLSEFAVELLALIFEALHDSGTATDLAHVAKTCRLFHDIAEPLIFRTVHFEYESLQYQLFRRRLLSEPDFGKPVHCFRLQLHGRCHVPLLDFLFPHMPNLKSLRWDTDVPDCHHKYLWRPIDDVILQIGLRESVQELEIACSNVYNIFMLMTTLPSLRRLAILRHSNDNGYKPVASRFSKIEELEFRMECKMPPDFVHMMLLSAQCLKSFTYFMPPPPMTGPPGFCFSPATLTTVIAPISQTVTSLHLSTGGKPTAHHDGTKLDLSNFSALKSLQACASCFVQPIKANAKEKTGLYKLLPKTLEFLHLEFSPILPLVDDLGEDGVWMMELACHKPDCFPALRRVLLSTLSKATLWLPPSQAMKEAFPKAGINLKVERRDSIRGACSILANI